MVTCTFRYDYDPATLAPCGRKCERPAVELIHWHDGRESAACEEHGIYALVPEVRRGVHHTSKIEHG